jgi:hypothetical protein
VRGETAEGTSRQGSLSSASETGERRGFTRKSEGIREVKETGSGSSHSGSGSGSGSVSHSGSAERVADGM